MLALQDTQSIQASMNRPIIIFITLFTFYIISQVVQLHANVSKQTQILDGIDIGPPKWAVCRCGLN